MIFVGCDLGSTTGKIVVLDENLSVLGSSIVRSSHGPIKTFEKAVEKTAESMGISAEELLTKFKNEGRVVTTGYGRSNLPGYTDEVSEISCHAKGASHLCPSVRTIIDIGGQDVKVLHIDNGAMTNFQMNDKCAAGTGRFLDVMAGVLEVKVQDLGHLDSLSKKRVEISSTCTVFAESEVISQLSMGTDKCDIIAGIHRSVAHRVTGLAHRIGVVPALVMTGGVAQNEGVVKALQNELGCEIHRSPLTQYNGALGAALYAYQAASRRA